MMSRAASLSELGRRVDLFNRPEWEALLKEDFSNRALSRDPVRFALEGRLSLRFAVWGFERKRHVVRILTGDLGSGVGGHGKLRDRTRNRLYPIAAMAPLMCDMCASRPTADKFFEEFSSSSFQSSVIDRGLVTAIQNARDQYELRVFEYDCVTVVLLLEKARLRFVGQAGKDLRPDASDVVSDIARLYYDYEAFRMPLWHCAPAKVLGERTEDISDLCNSFADPLSFGPMEVDRSDLWLWPWQRCLMARMEEPSKVQISPIMTTSLVMDIRASTVAMDLTKPTEKYAEFIDTAVRLARETILAAGGYFDKETGDGVVGHFCHSRTFGQAGVCSSSEMVDLRAIVAAQRIIQKVRLECLKYQRWLRHGVDRLGAAIGIHSGAAVWLADEKQIRAIGSSVVGASRMCCGAEKDEIVISNRVFQAPDFPRGPINGLEFHKKPIALKEYGGSIDAYAYAAKVAV